MGSKCGTLPSWDPLCTCKSVCIRRETTCLPPIQLHRLLFTDFVVFQNECFQRWIPRNKIFQWFSCFTLLYDVIFKSGTCDCSFYSLQPLFSKFQVVTMKDTQSQHHARKIMNVSQRGRVETCGKRMKTMKVFYWFLWPGRLSAKYVAPEHQVMSGPAPIPYRFDPP